MICIVLHCDQDGCNVEQGYPMPTIRQEHIASETDLMTAVRLASMYGWRLDQPEWLGDSQVFCPDHNGL